MCNQTEIKVYMQVVNGMIGTCANVTHTWCLACLEAEEKCLDLRSVVCVKIKRVLLIQYNVTDLLYVIMSLI